jgi:hypothetical protein
MLSCPTFAAAHCVARLQDALVSLQHFEMAHNFPLESKLISGIMR